jgi:hypothetical protein
MSGGQVGPGGGALYAHCRAPAREGFVAKASGFYKKIVKIHPEDDAALLRMAELSAQQGLAADARMQLQALFQQRLRRGDTARAAEVALAYAAVDPADAAGRFESGRMLADLGDPGGGRKLARPARPGGWAKWPTPCAAGRARSAIVPPTPPRGTCS